MKRIFTYIALGLLLAVLLLTACGQQRDKIIVASHRDTEGAVLAQLIILKLRAELEGQEVDVIDKTWMGSTEELREALINGDIDIYPEYTGNGAFFFDETESEVWNDAETGYKRVHDLDLEQNDVKWLQKAPANNTWAIAVSRNVADSKGLETIEDLKEYVNESGGSVVFYGSEEFFTSPMALHSFEKKYGFSLDWHQKRIVSSPTYAEHLVAKLGEKKETVYAAMAYYTDGYLSKANLQVLSDPKHAQPFYAPAPIIRLEVHERYPDIEEWLNPIFESLDNETLQKLNAEIDFLGGKGYAVARSYLLERGLLPKGKTSEESPADQLPTDYPTPDFFNADANEEGIEIVNNKITVEPKTLWQTEFYVDGDFMSNVRVAGWFKASGGAFNDIKILILNDVDFINWQNFHDIKGIYQSDKVTKAEIKEKITEPGSYHLVISNRFSEFSSKDVLLKVYLYYQ